MISYTEDVKIISSFHKKSKTYGKIESRASHGFIFRNEGSAEYFFDGKCYKVDKRHAIFLPEGAKYEYRTDGNIESLYTSINFKASFTKASVAVYPIEDFYGSNYISQSFTELFKFGTESDKFKCLSIFYDFLSYVLRLDNLSSSEKNKYDSIEPAVNYLKKHIFDCSLKVNKLNDLCGFSDTYFRSLFKSRFGVSPREYVLRERITQAKSILESGDFDSIKEVSALVGYNDALYFSKAFKKFYGFPPSDI